MFCKRCGAGLREEDLYCSCCGAPVEKTPQGRYDDTLYREDRHRYRDSFLEKKEEKSHALLVTVTILLVMAVLVVAFVILFFFSKRNTMTPGDQDAVMILSDETQGQGAAQNGGWEGDITIFTESSPDSGAAEKETEKTKPEEKEEIPTEVQTEKQTEQVVQTEADTQQAENAAVDMGKIRRILSRDSTVNRSEVFIYDLNHFKEYCTEGSDQPMYASALISVPVLYTAAALLDQGQLTLNDLIPYVNSIGGRGEANPEEREGQSYPLSYYLKTMLTYSDNNCMNCLIDYLGLERINRTCQSAGFSSVDLQRKIVAEVTDGKDNYVSARDLAGMLKELYLGKFKTLGGEFVRQYFKIDTGDGYRTVIGLASDIPSGTLFLNQNGRGDTRYNEIALVADETHQYIICIMCNGDYGFQYETAVENISNYVYQSLTFQG